MESNSGLDVSQVWWFPSLITQGAEARGSLWFQGQYSLHGKFQVSQLSSETLSQGTPKAGQGRCVRLWTVLVND